MANELFIESISKQTFDQNKQMLKDLDEMISKVEELNKRMKDAKWPSQVKAAVREVNAEVEKANKLTNDSEVAQRRLAKATQNTRIARMKEGKAIQQQRVEAAALNKESRQSAVLTSNLSGAYTKLNLQRTIAKQKLLDLLVVERASNVELQKARRNFEVLDRRVRMADKAVGDHTKSVGNYRKALAGARDIMAAFGLASGIFLVADLARNTFKIAREMQSLHFAMQAVIESEKELIETREFLTKLSNDYGANLVTLTRNYTKFYAATKTSNLTLEQTRDIFETAAKAAGVLGLRQDELNGVYLAFEQMISKGKVSTEELRRQLGERLPGAFKLMAEALGVSTQELDDMLRKGEILSEDALPKLAAQIRKTYGLDAITSVENLNASVTRLTNAWVTFVDNITESEGPISKALIAVLGFLTDMIKVLNLLNSSYEEYQATLNNDVAGQVLAQQKQRYIELGDEAAAYAKIDKERAEQAIANLKSQLYYAKLVMIQEEEAGRGFKEFAGYVVNNGSKAFREAGTEVQNLNRDLAREIAILEAAEKQLQGVTKETKTFGGEKDKAKTILQGTVAWYERLIKALEDERSRLAQNSREYKTYTDLIEDAQKQLHLFMLEIEGVNELRPEGTEGTIAYTNALESMRDELKKVKIEGLEGADAFTEYGKVLKRSEKYVRELKKATNEFLDSSVTDFFQESGMESLQTFFDGSFQKRMAGAMGDWTKEFAVGFNTVTEIAQEAFAFMTQLNDAYYQTAIANAAQERDLRLKFAGDSASAREIIEKEYDEEVRRIQAKQAEDQKQIAIFNTIVNTAQAIVAALANPGGPAGLVLASVVGAIGLAQTAMISATPIPQFKDGVRNFEGGVALVNDAPGSRYKEVITTPTGGVIKPQKRNTLVNLPKGSNVYKDYGEFERSLQGVLTESGINFINAGPSISSGSSGQGIDYNRIGHEFDKSLSKYASGDTNVVNIDKNGVTTYVQTANSKKTILNNRVNFRSRK